MASGKVTRATCGESIREQVKCEKRRSSRLEDVLRPLACQRSAEGGDERTVAPTFVCEWREDFEYGGFCHDKRHTPIPR